MVMHVDRSSNFTRSGIDLILARLEGIVTEYILCFEFLTTSNKIKYEALIIRLKIAKEHRVQELKIYSDSQLMVGQVRRDYKAQKENIKRYLYNIKDLITAFVSFDIR